MTISDESRYRLYLRLEQVLGPEEATVLMESLPPGGWAAVATKRDIDALGLSTKRDLEALGLSTKRDIDSLAVATKRDIDALGLSTRRDMEAVRVDMRGLEDRVDLRFDAFSARMDARLERELRLMSWRVILAMLTLASLAVAAPHL